jgi:hypothetical protein
MNWRQSLRVWAGPEVRSCRRGPALCRAPLSGSGKCLDHRGFRSWPWVRVGREGARGRRHAVRGRPSPHVLPRPGSRLAHARNPRAVKLGAGGAYAVGVRRALVLLSLASAACGRCSDGRLEEPADARACASACAALVSAGCERPGLTPADAPRCASACVARNDELAGSGCAERRRAYLGCVSTTSIDCASARSAAAVCIEQREGIVGCAHEHADYMACIAPCLHAGAEHQAERTLSVGGRERRLQAQSVRLGCAPCPDTPKPGAAPGSACQSPKVCAERCCTCPDARVRFSTRVCVDARCAGDDACELARALGPDPCRVERP